MKIEQLKPYANNPRKNDGAVDVVANSIKQFGFRVPIIVDKNNVIVAGHTRYKASKKLGLKEVPVIVADDLTEEQVKAFRLADNKVSEASEWDYNLLEIELNEIGLDMEMFGFDINILNDEVEVTEDDFEVKVPEVPKSKVGDIYQLGNNRLMCGDSTSKEAVNRLMDGNKADLVFTDPPYGMKKEAEGVLNDNLNYDDLLQFNKQWIPHTFDALKDNGSWYCWGIDEPLMDIYSNILKPMIKANEITFRNLITWNKTHSNPTYRVNGFNSEELRSYYAADEKCLFVMCGVQGFNNNSDNYFEAWEPIRQYLASEAEKAGIGAKELKEITGVGMWGHWFTKSQWTFIPEEHYKKLQAFGKEYGAFGKEYEQIKKEYEQIKKEYYSTRAYFNNTHDKMKDTWTIEITGNEERELTGGHATPKPIALCSRAIKSSSREGEVVLDVFGGSGSTLIACEQLNRKCYMMELDCKYIQVIIERYIAFTGNKVYRLNDDGTKTDWEDIK